MATLNELKSAIDALLAHPLGISGFKLAQEVQEKAYEAYVFGLCLRAVRELGVIPELRAVKGAANPFVFRGGPSKIHSTFRNYGFAWFSINKHEFEIHANIEFVGSSRMLHEVDVCLMNAQAAIKCRSDFMDPSSAGLVAAWECKFYAGSLDKVLGRAFVGLMDDMGGKVRVSGLCSNSANDQLRRYLRPRQRPYPHFKLTPLHASNEDVFVNMLKGELKKLTAF